jgi:hypothetical protein
MMEPIKFHRRTVSFVLSVKSPFSLPKYLDKYFSATFTKT